MNDDQWYFAYGSNLDIDQKQARTKGIRQAVRCRLRGYRLACNKRGRNGDVYANIVPDAAAEVWGVIYLCCPDALLKMDRCEGVESRCLDRPHGGGGTSLGLRREQPPATG